MQLFNFIVEYLNLHKIYRCTKYLHNYKIKQKKMLQSTENTIIVKLKLLNYEFLWYIRSSTFIFKFNHFFKKALIQNIHTCIYIYIIPLKLKSHETS